MGRIEELMEKSGVKFGTSGARGLVADMTDEVCYAYTVAFIQHLESTGELTGRGVIAIGGDLRSSTDRIMEAVGKAVVDKGYSVRNCGKLPSPALAYYGIREKIPAVMVTGSHIPEDRNGIKYNKKKGEILKHDEAGIKNQDVIMPEGLFDLQGMLVNGYDLSSPDREAEEIYIRRYLDFFPPHCLEDKKICVYQHSAVGRDLIVKILSGLGADVIPLCPSKDFVPVDTEALRPEDVEAAERWAEEYDFFAIVSTDGDSDRPLIGDEKGKWLRGDIAGILCAEYLKADTVVVPVSCNSALEKCGRFKRIIRTRIGSPYVIEVMEQAVREGGEIVVGYEANGGFLTATDIIRGDSVLHALPTRDAVILLISILLLASEKGLRVSDLSAGLPGRFTFSNRLKNFPAEKSGAWLRELNSGDDTRDRHAIGSVFGKLFGEISSIDRTDGLRITFISGDIIHLRPSGNAPEFRCYTEAETEERVKEINRICMELMENVR